MIWVLDDKSGILMSMDAASRKTKLEEEIIAAKLADLYPSSIYFFATLVAEETDNEGRIW
jgi:hypothetical protein